MTNVRSCPSSAFIQHSILEASARSRAAKYSTVTRAAEEPVSGTVTT